LSSICLSLLSDLNLGVPDNDLFSNYKRSPLPEETFFEKNKMKNKIRFGNPIDLDPNLFPDF
jgi:hypothetical protein